MFGPLNDTRPEAERVLIEGYRRMSAAEKLACIRRLNALARNLIFEDVRRRHPGASENEVRLRAASRWIPAELMRRAYGWDPDVEGY